MVEKTWIGMMDSGVGGLTVAKEVRRLAPYQPIVYFGDSLRCPYGPREPEEVIQFSKEIVQYLSRYPLKMLVIACNTATAVALSEIRKMLSIPVLGVIEPGARAALAATRTGRVGVIGTQGTIGSGAYEQALRRLNPDVQVLSQACPSFVPLVEKGLYCSSEAKRNVQEVLKGLCGQHLDTLILGCTHYPLLQPLIQEVLGEGITLINSAEETAREVAQCLGLEIAVNSLAEEWPSENHSLFFTSGDPRGFQRVLQEWLGITLPVSVHHPQEAGMDAAKASLLVHREV